MCYIKYAIYVFFTHNINFRRGCQRLFAIFEGGSKICTWKIGNPPPPAYVFDSSLKTVENIHNLYEFSFFDHPGYPIINEELKDKGLNAIKCHRVIDGGKDNIGNDIVVSGEGTGIVHIATCCGAIDNKIGKKESLVEIAPLDDEAKYIEGFDFLTGV